jgi:hypothetical protein
MKASLPGAYVSPAYLLLLEQFVSQGLRRGHVLRVASECGLGLLAWPIKQMAMPEGLALLTAYWSHLFTPETDVFEALADANGEPLVARAVLDTAASGEVPLEVAQALAAKLASWDSLERYALLCRLRIALSAVQGTTRAPAMRPSQALVAAGIVGQGTDEDYKSDGQ